MNTATTMNTVATGLSDAADPAAAGVDTSAPAPENGAITPEMPDALTAEEALSLTEAELRFLLSSGC